MYVPAIRNDIVGEGSKKALAQEIDEDSHRGLPPYATYVARTVLMHTLAFNDQLKGLAPEHLRYSILGPRTDISFVEAARAKFIAQSAYLDDRPGSPLRFLAEANLTQIIRRQEGLVDQGELRAHLNDRIKGIFSGAVFDAVPFPGGPWDVPDEVGNGRPLLAVMSYDGCGVGSAVDSIPDLIVRLFERKGAEGGGLRALRNNLAFVVAEEGRVDDMKRQTARRMALREMRAPERLSELAEHQQAKVRELEARSETEVAITIQQCYRHVFYPSRTRVPGASVDLAHTALETHSASEKPGSGQQQVVRALRELRKLRASEDDPDAPAYVRDRTPLKRGQITTLALRDEFRRDASLPILVGDDVFVRGIRLGVDKGEFVYRRGELLYGQGDPNTSIHIDEQSSVFTMVYAKDHGIWPRPAAQPAAGGSGSTSPHPETPLPADKANDPSKPPPTISTGPSGAATFTAEGVLREALIRLWEQARNRKIEKIAVLTIRMFDATDAFRLLNVVAGLRNAEKKRVVIQGAYETLAGSTLQIEYDGTPTDTQPLKDFLEPQLRAAKDKNLSARFEITFAEGLPMAGDVAEKVTDQLTRYATGSAYVEATAEAKP